MDALKFLMREETITEFAFTDCHISVCICTYKRPKNLGNLIEGLINQKTNDRFTYSIIIVDNDPAESAKEIVYDYMVNSSPGIEYHPEPRKGLSYARNKTLACSTGDYIAFIDDDEVPETDWLYQLYKTLTDFGADAVFGSVFPEFEGNPPNWILNRKYFYWRDVRNKTGTRTKKAVTNNVLFRRDLVVRYNLRFDHDHDFTGGEDMGFFFVLASYKKDALFIDCKDAIVHEVIPPDRCNTEYIRKRNILEARGTVNAIYKKYADSRVKKKVRIISRILHSWIRLIVINLFLPFLLKINRDLGVEYYHRSYFHHGILLAIFNFTFYKDRKSIGLQ
jgi:glycosyltransferase involved in cell wall biosynthesis